MTRRVNRPHLKPGPAPKQPPPGTAARIRQLAAKGHSLVGIRRGLNVSHVVLNRWLDEYPDLAEALAQGRASEEFEMHNVLYRAAKKGNIVAAMFVLKSRFGWREGDQSDLANKVSINFTLPGAMSPEQFTGNVIDNEPTPAPLPVPTKSPKDA
jgi:hypothetical protein